MAIALVQSSEGTSTSATTTPTFSVAPTAGNLVGVAFASEDLNGSPNAWATQSTGMEQAGFHGSYIWWAISNGTNSLPYTIGSAVNSSWVAFEFSGVDAAPYLISNGQIANSPGDSYTTPSITPPAGNCLLLASMAGVSASGDMSEDTYNWLNSFTHFRSSGPVSGSGGRNVVGCAYRLVTANGSTGYSTGASYSELVYTPSSRSGLIIAFKEAAAVVSSSTRRKSGMVSMGRWMGN